jgi:thiol-disulfide isomerase/thioredoxin
LKRLFVFLFLLTAIFILSCSTKRESSPVIGGAAPLFKVQTLEGSYFSLSEFRGKVVLIEFWATWCPPCKASIPEIEALKKRFNDNDLVVLGINLDEGADIKERVAAFKDAYKITYPIGLDSDGKISSKYRVSSIPMIYLLDRNLKIAQIYTGYTPGMGEKISKEIEALL